MVCLAPQCLYLQAFITVLLGLLWSRLIVGSQPHFWTQKDIIPRGSTSVLGTSPGHCVKSPLSGQGVGAHLNTFRKLSPAETCFELSLIIFLAISDPDKCWPEYKNVWVRSQVREFGVAFEQVCVDLISLRLSDFLAQTPLECKNQWSVGPQSWESKSSKSVRSFQLLVPWPGIVLPGTGPDTGDTREISLLLLWLGR